MGENEATLLGVLIFSASIIVFTAVIIRFKLRNKELEMRGKELEMRGSNAELGPVVDALRNDLTDMQEHTRAQLADMQERLDFAERLLTAGRASQEDRSG